MPTFRSVLRGYDPEEVNAEIESLTRELEETRRQAATLQSDIAAPASVDTSELESAVVALQDQLDKMSGYAADLERQVAQSPKTPTFADLGERIAQMLTLAEAESEDMRGTAKAETEKLRSDTQTSADQTRITAEAYGADVRAEAEAEATRIVTQAQRQAEEIVDQADREAQARREEAEAIYESQRARTAVAAADFEKTLAERRDEAAKDFAAQMQAQDEAMKRAEDALSQIEEEAERYKAEVQDQADATIKEASVKAADILKAAKQQAEKIRRESEREVQAASARRDAITLQLSNVRQMLSTMGVAPKGFDEDIAPVEAVADEVEEAEPVEEPQA